MGGGRVARRAGVDDHDAAARPAEHERGAQPGGPAADDRDVIGVHVSMQRPACTPAARIARVRCRFWESPVASAPWRRDAIPDVLAEVGPRLRRLRERRGLTLTALAAQTGISKSTLSRLESGQRKPSLELLLPLAEALSPAARRARRRAAGRRPARPARAQDPQRPARLSADAAVQRHGRVEGRDPARARAQAAHPRRLRVAVRALRRDAADPRRARHHDAAPARSPSSTPALPHWFGPAGDEPVEILSVHGSHGERMHVRAAPRTPAGGGPGA